MNGKKYERRLRAAWRGGFAAVVSLIYSSVAVGQITLEGDQPVPRTLVVLEVTEAGTDGRLPCHVYLKDSEGQPVEPTGYPFWIDHFACDGRAEIRLAEGDYTYEIDRGPEYRLETGSLHVVDGKPLHLACRLRRLADLSAEAWYSGETHVHRPVEQTELLMRAADLHIAEVITWWNNTNLWQSRRLPESTIVRFDGNRFYDLLAGEDERGGGALLFFQLRQPLAIGGSQHEYPSAVEFINQARERPNVWIDIEKPFWWDFPMWLTTGAIDSVGLVHNHLQRDGLLDNEAWGRARDLSRYPGVTGNGLWTQQIYFHMLNAGFRIPPTAGSASGVLRNPLGYNRAYVHVPGELTYEQWWQNLRAGHVFVTNGPLLRVRANGQLPGSVLRGAGSLRVTLDGRLDSRDPIGALELVSSGGVEPVTLPCELNIRESGWFLLRATADVSRTYRVACTGPFYVEIDGQPARVQRESAEFFLDWVRQRIDRLTLEDPQHRAEVLRPLQAAEQFWLRRVAAAKPAP